MQPGTSQEHPMTHTRPSGGHPAPRPQQPAATTLRATHRPLADAQHTGAIGVGRRRYRRVLTVGGTVILTVVTFAALLVAGALVTNHGLHQPVPIRSGDTVRDVSDAVQAVSADVAVHRGRPLV